MKQGKLLETGACKVVTQRNERSLKRQPFKEDMEPIIPSLLFKPTKHYNFFFYIINNFGGIETFMPMDKVGLQPSVNKQE
jgi:hypothetical protein